MIIDQQSLNTFVVSPSTVLNLWQQQPHLSAKQNQHPNSMSSHSTQIMDEPRLPNRTIIMRDDADETPIIFHQHRSKSNKRISDHNVTCDKVNDNCSNEEESNLRGKNFWTFSTMSSVPVKLKLLSRFVWQEVSVNLTPENNINNSHKNASDIDRNIGSDFHIGKCKNFNVKTTRGCRSSVYRKTIFWQCCLIFMYIFLLNLSTSTCFAARQEGKCATF